MTEAELQAWVKEQIRVLVSSGIAPLDAVDMMKRVVAALPLNVDPRSYTPPLSLLNVEITKADIADARAEWYASETVSPTFKMLLDAQEITANAT
jgi:hypothetical protein